MKQAGAAALALFLTSLAGCGGGSGTASPAASGHASTAAASDPLPGWNATGSRAAIVAFVERVTKTGSSEADVVQLLEAAQGAEVKT